MAHLLLASGSLLLCLGSLLAATPTTDAHPQPGEPLNFVACPMIRDTEHPCWLAEYQGELYFLGVQGSAGSHFYPPQLKHKALIEGFVSDQPTMSGGIVLDPVKVSTLRELDYACDSILPAEGYLVQTDERGPTPPARQQPRRSSQPKVSEAVQREFVIAFDFDMERPWIRDAIRIGAAAEYAKQISARSIEVIGYRGFARLTNGEVMEELPHLAQLRMRKVADALLDLGVSPSVLTTRYEADAVGPDPQARRAVIRVTP